MMIMSQQDKIEMKKENAHFAIIDYRMRIQEKNYLKTLGYSLIELPKFENVYDEISSHTDIFISKVNNNLVIEPSLYNYVKSKLDNANISIIKGEEHIEEKYPNDIYYNVCVLGKTAIHNFNYTSKSILDILNANNFNLINVKQGYANCSIAVIDDNSIIVSDKGVYKELSKYDFDILLLENDLDIKLLNRNNYSDKKGFIGGCIARVENKVIVFGDLSKIDYNDKIKKFITNKGLEIVDFKGIDIIDYGGIVII